MKGLILAKKIIRTCVVCNQPFDLIKREGFNSAMLKMDLDEFFMCYNCLKDAMRLLELKNLWHAYNDKLNVYSVIIKTLKQVRWGYCKYCLKRFHSNHGNQKFCSHECFKKYRKEYKRTNANKNYQKKEKEKRIFNPIFCKYCNNPILVLML